MWLTAFKSARARLIRVQYARGHDNNGYAIGRFFRRSFAAIWSLLVRFRWYPCTARESPGKKAKKSRESIRGHAFRKTWTEKNRIKQTAFNWRVFHADQVQMKRTVIVSDSFIQIPNILKSTNLILPLFSGTKIFYSELFEFRKKILKLHLQCTTNVTI